VYVPRKGAKDPKAPAVESYDTSPPSAPPTRDSLPHHVPPRYSTSLHLPLEIRMIHPIGTMNPQVTAVE